MLRGKTAGEFRSLPYFNMKWRHSVKASKNSLNCVVKQHLKAQWGLQEGSMFLLGTQIQFQNNFLLGISLNFLLMIESSLMLEVQYINLYVFQS